MSLQLRPGAIHIGTLKNTLKVRHQVAVLVGEPR